MMDLTFQASAGANAGPDERALSDEIARLEAEIEALSDRLERCRKVALLSKLAMGAGAAWFVAFVLGILSFDPALMIAAIAAVLGGIVANGSNTTTAEQIREAMRATEARRAELIGMIKLRLVGATIH